jgi:hypothetical protein
MILVVAVLVLGCAGLALASVGLVRLWRREVFSADMPSWWPYGGALWRGYVRAMPVGSISFLVLMAGLLILIFVPTEGGCCGFAVPNWFVFPFLISFFGTLGLALSVILFNRPRFIVPPHLRSQVGAISEWLRSRR